MAKREKTTTDRRSAMITGAFVLLVLASLLPPIALAAAQIAATPDPSNTDLPFLSEVLHIAGAQHIPQWATTPATLGTLALWFWMQTNELAKHVRKRGGPRGLERPGLHCAAALIWTGSAALLLNEHQIWRPAEVGAEIAAAAAGIATMYALAGWRSEPDDPYSSLIGRAKPATDALRAAWNQKLRKSRREV